MHDLPHRLVGVPARGDVSYLKIKALEAQMALYRGYLHEVNNALAGIGSLAEVLKDSSGPVLSKNLDLIVNAASRSGILQRRIRALYSEDNIKIGINIPEFLNENKDLMELMLPREQRLNVEMSSKSGMVKTTPDRLWGLFSLVVLWIKESESPKIGIICEENGILRISLSPPSAFSLSADQPWESALAEAGKAVGANATMRDYEVILKFPA